MRPKRDIRRIRVLARSSARRLASALAADNPNAAALCIDPTYAEEYETYPSDHDVAAVINAARALVTAIDDMTGND
jgi:hypothetical protein